MASAKWHLRLPDIVGHPSSVTLRLVASLPELMHSAAAMPGSEPLIAASLVAIIECKLSAPQLCDKPPLLLLECDVLG